jgi:hypothetical protein
VVSNNAAPPTIYLNNQRGTGNWLRVVLAGDGKRSSRDALGARARLTVLHDGRPRTLSRWVEVGSGYASQSEFTLHFGLGGALAIESLEITWPGGTVQKIAKDELAGVINETIIVEQHNSTFGRQPPVGQAFIPATQTAAGR